MQRVLVCLVALCVLSPLATYAQDAPAPGPPVSMWVPATTTPPASLEGGATFTTLNYSLLLRRDATTTDDSTEPDPSPDPQGNGNGTPSALPATGYVFPSRSE